jgi:hypothetical protein
VFGTLRVSKTPSHFPHSESRDRGVRYGAHLAPEFLYELVAPAAAAGPDLPRRVRVRVCYGDPRRLQDPLAAVRASTSSAHHAMPAGATTRLPAGGPSGQTRQTRTAASDSISCPALR